ncbi:MAG TPA: peptidoglycan-binding domain-containing protein [Myxococcales bacterium]|jgi:peptidoglycan hydrolase-like protein with peptidoglycan-binding domain
MPKTTGIQPAIGASGTSRSSSPSLDDVAAGRGALRRGMSGDSVRDLQQLLKDSGQSLAVDGVFGPQTEAAVRAFQLGHKLAVDGLVGPQTLGSLRGETPPAQNPFATDRMDEPRPQTPPTSTSTSTPIAGMPARAAGAETGSQFIARTAGMSRTQREQAILAELQKGNIPDFLRQWKEVEVQTTGPDGTVHTGKVRVMPDYLAIGSDDDFVRIPMNPLTAQRVADQYGCSLPTTKIVDDVWKQADVKLKPSPMTAGPQMMSNDYFLRHQQTVERQLAGQEPGALTAGHKKDVVISNRLAAHPDRVAIYGWQQANGKNIQPLSTAHENTYADYSHGIRMVDSTMVVDGVERPLEEILRDPVLCKLVSSEGVIRDPRVPS